MRKEYIISSSTEWCLIEMTDGVASITFLSTTERQSRLSFQAGAVPESRLSFLQILKKFGIFFETRLGYPSFYGSIWHSICISVQLYRYFIRSFRICVFFLPTISLSEKAQFICDL